MKLLLTPIEMRALRRLPRERRRIAFRRIREKGYMKGTAWAAYHFRDTHYSDSPKSKDDEYMQLCLVLGRIL